MDPSEPVLVIDAFDDPLTLDPHLAFDTASRHPVLNIYDGLLGLDEDRRVRPVLAAALPASPPRRAEAEVVVPIRDDVVFHDGTPLTIDDVVYSLRRMAITADGPAGLWSDALLGAPTPTVSEAIARELVGRITPSEEGVVLRLREPYAPLNALLVQWSLVVSRAWCAARGEWDGTLPKLGRFVRREHSALDDQANGTGPYALEQWDRRRRQLRFRRRRVPGAQRPGAPATVVLRSVDDREEREDNLLAGRCDFSVCQPESRARLGDLRGVVLEKLPDEWSINPLGFITQHITPGAVALGSGDFGPDGLPPDAFADVHLRRMLGLCFDHRRYVDDVLDGEGLLHLPPFPAPALAGGAVSPPVFDLERARDELRLAWGGRVARSGCQIVIYTHAANISRVRAAEYLAEGLSAVNPRIVPVIEAIDFPTLTTMLYAGRCPVAWAGWASDFLHPHAFASALLDPRAPLPAALGMDDRQLTDLLHSARAVDGTAGRSAYRRLAAYATDRALFLAPPGKMSYMTYADRWTGVRLKNHVPNVLDFDSFRLRLVGQGSP